MSDKDPRKLESPFRFPSLVNYQPERQGGNNPHAPTPHPHFRTQPRLPPPPRTPRRYPTILEDQPNNRRLRPISRQGGRTIQRTTEQNLIRRDKERLDAILSRGNSRNSRSDTNLFKAPQRSAQIIKELCNDGFIARHRYGGLGYDVSLGGRPMRLSPIGVSERRPPKRGGKGKKRKKDQQGKGGKRTKRDKKEKNSLKIENSGWRPLNGRAGSDVGWNEDWEDVEEEEEEEEEEE